MTICPVCLNPPRLDRQGFKPVRINLMPCGHRIEFTEWRNLATCETPDCPLHDVTLSEEAYQTMTKTDGENYLKGRS